MLINWFTVIAQIINFLILVVLLKYLLYNRIIRAMDKREEEIQERMEEARNKIMENEQQAENNRREREDFEQKRKEMLSQAEEEAEEKRRVLSLKNREEVDMMRVKWQQSLEREQTSFLRQLRQLAAKQVYAVSRRSLRDLASRDLDEQIADIFVSKIEELNKGKKAEISALIQGEKAATVSSGFEISAESRRKITDTVRSEIDDGVDISFKTDPEIIMGVELQIRGQKISWSLKNYLDELENRAREALEEESKKGQTTRKKEGRSLEKKGSLKEKTEREATGDKKGDEEPAGSDS